VLWNPRPDRRLQDVPMLRACSHARISRVPSAVAERPPHCPLQHRLPQSFAARELRSPAPTGAPQPPLQRGRHVLLAHATTPAPKSRPPPVQRTTPPVFGLGASAAPARRLRLHVVAQAPSSIHRGGPRGGCSDE